MTISLPSHLSAAEAEGKSAAHPSTGVLGTADIVFMVMAAAAPMGGVVMLFPIAFAFGNGVGLPGTYLGAIVAMLLFAIGYVRIIPHVQNAGAFYAYIAAAVGRVAGLAAAYIAAFSYFALAASTLTALAYFCERSFEQSFGISLHWSVWAFAGLLLIAILSYHRITLAAKVLGFVLAAEVIVILVLDFAILAQTGWDDINFDSFSMTPIVAPGLGVAMIYAFNTMLGVEGTAIYQEEARNPRVTVPRATYVAVVLVGLFYVFTAWCLVMAVGDNIATVAKADPGAMVVNQTLSHVGKWGANVVSVLVLTSAFAAGLGLFNNSARYLYALGRDGVLPKALAKTHPRHRSPHIAALVLTVALMGSVGLMTLLAITSLIIPIYFAKQRMFGLKTTVAPALGGLMIGSATVLAFMNYHLLTGVDSVVINRLPYLLVALAIVGVVQALWLRRNDPVRYQRIASTRIDKDPH
jgi:amino acid transporter